MLQKNDLTSIKLQIEKRFIERTKIESKKSELETQGVEIDKELSIIDQKVNFENHDPLLSLFILSLTFQWKPLSSEISELGIIKSKLLSDREIQLHDFKKKIEKAQKFQIQAQNMQKQISDYIHSSNEATLRRFS